VITPIGLDHQEYLGPDRETIGGEKAGILRSGKPCVCGEADPPRSVLDAASRCGADLRRLGREFSIGAGTGGATWHGPEGHMDLPLPVMAGGHQLDNLATAVAAVAALVPAVVQQAPAVGAAVTEVRVPGRLQLVAGSPRVLLDVGHNPLAAEVVARALRRIAPRPVLCVLGMLRDKDAHTAAGALDGVVARWFCCGLGGERGRSGEALAREVAAVSGNDRVEICDTVAAGLASAFGSARPDDTVLVFGSFHTVAEAARSPALAGRLAQL
jgi:dihydrofolate synthase/folylpolyglutamate synthase